METINIKKGDRVHIDAQDEEWGRVASDATVEFVHKSYVLVSVDTIRATIAVLPREVNKKEV